MTEEMESLVSAVGTLAEKIDRLVDAHDKLIKYLLLVVCVMALGRGLVDMKNELLETHPAAASSK